MSRKLLSLGVLAAAFTLVLGTTDAQARSCRSHRHHRHNGCCQTSNYGPGNCGHQQVVNYGCQQTQPVSHVTTNTSCNPSATCCSAQSACAISVHPASFSAPQPPVEQAAPAPVPSN